MSASDTILSFNEKDLSTYNKSNENPAFEKDVPRLIDKLPIDPAVIAKQQCAEVLLAVEEFLTDKYILFSQLVDPVVAADGFTYERASIERWFREGKRTSPHTGAVLPNEILIPNRDLHKFNEEIKSIYKKYDYDHSQEAKQILQKILGEDYDEEPMQKIIGHVIIGFGSESAQAIIRGISYIGNPKYNDFGITDVDKITRIRKKLRTAITALSGGARKRRTRATTVKQRKSSRRQLRIRRRRRTNKK
jgi:hypothetical protein